MIVGNLISLSKQLFPFLNHQFSLRVLQEKNKVRGLSQIDFKDYYEAVVINTEWY